MLLELDDLVDLGEELRRADFRLSPSQIVAAQRVVAALETERAAVARENLAPFLGPIFCASAADQRRFPDLYGAWLPKRYRDAPVPPPPRSAPKAARPLISRRARALWKPAVAAIGLILLGLVSWATWQHWRARTVIGSVVEAGTTRGVPGAVVVLGDETATTDASGRFQFTDQRASDFPEDLSVTKTDYVSQSLQVGVELHDLRYRLYLGAAISGQLYLKPIDLTSSPKRDRQDLVKIELPPESDTSAGEVRLDRTVDFRTVIPRATIWDRVIGSRVALTFAPLGLFALWGVARILRRPVLQRDQSTTPSSLREVHLPGGVTALAPGLPLRRLAQELRRRRTVLSSEVQTDATIAATLRNGGLFTPVFGSRVEPDYLVLVDTACLSDHQSKLADELIGELVRSDVLIERYYFDRNPSLCELHREIGPGTKKQQLSRAGAVPLDELQARHPAHRVLLFTDGSGLFDPFTGAPKDSIRTLLEWEMPFILTSKPEAQWGDVEWALQSLGLKVLPFNRAGVLSLMSTLSGSPEVSAARGRRPSSRVLPLYERAPRRWLERDAPDAESVSRVCESLRRDLGERGFAWLAACAAYPEIHWGITLRLGAALVANRAEFESLLPRLTRLVWLREAFIPDWFRRALLLRLSPADEEVVRTTLNQLLGSVSGDQKSEIPLRIASGPARGPDGKRTLLARLRGWLGKLRAGRRAKAMIESAPPGSPLRDYVFLRFIAGQSLGKLAADAPGQLLKVLFRGGSPLLGFRTWLIVAATLATCGAIGFVASPVHTGTFTTPLFAAHYASDGNLEVAYGSILEPVQARMGAGYPERVLAYGATEEQGLLLTRLPNPGPDERQQYVPSAAAFSSGSDPLTVAFAVGNPSMKGVSASELPTNASTSSRLRFSQLDASCDPDCNSTPGAVAVSADGKLVASSWSGGVKTIRANGEGKLLPSASPITNLAFNSTGGLLAGTFEDGFTIWDVEQGVVGSNRVGEKPRAIAFSEDRTTLYVALSRTVGAWGTGTDPRFTTATVDGEISSLAVSPNGRLLAATWAAKDQKSGGVTLFNAADGARLFQSTTGRAIPRRPGFNRDNTALAVPNSDGTVDVWTLPANYPGNVASRSFALILSPNATEATANALRTRFGFGVTVLSGQNYSQVLDAMKQFRDILQPSDTFLLIADAGTLSDEDLGADRFSIRDLPARNRLVMIPESLLGAFGNNHEPMLLFRESAIDWPKLSTALGSLSTSGPLPVAPLLSALDATLSPSNTLEAPTGFRFPAARTPPAIAQPRTPFRLTVTGDVMNTRVGQAVYFDETAQDTALAAKSVVFTNASNRSVRLARFVDNDAPVPRDFELADTCDGYTLAAKASCRVTVRFTPSAGGLSFAWTLSYAEAGTSDPRVSVQLRGTASAGERSQTKGPPATSAPDQSSSNAGAAPNQSQPNTDSPNQALPAQTEPSSAAQTAQTAPNQTAQTAPNRAAPSVPNQTTQAAPNRPAPAAPSLSIQSDQAPSNAGATNALQRLEVSGDATSSNDGSIVDFQSVPVGSSLTRQIRITNTLDRAVRLQSAMEYESRGIFSRKDSCTGRTLNVKETCEIMLEFRARQPGEFSDTIRYVDSETNALRAQLILRAVAERSKESYQAN